MGGRVHDIAVLEKSPRTFYLATASGGLWRTTNGGINFQPLWGREAAAAMGAVALDPTQPDVIWVGTGEQNNRNSTSWGAGVYRSTDAGKTWTHMGLAETRHIGQLLIDPRNPNVVYVAALGRLWGPNPERGLYKTTDGGATWQHVLSLDEDTGVVDLAMDPGDPDHLLAAAYERRRWAWSFSSGGRKSGLYRSTDAGKTWRKVSQGLPTGEVGRIGVSFHRADPRLVVATVEAPTGGVFLSRDRGVRWERVNSLNPRPFYFSKPKFDPVDPNRIYVLGVELHVSNDQGRTFRTFNIPVHADFHGMWIDPTDNEHLIVANDGGAHQSRDAGKSWEHLNDLRLGQFYAVAVDMRKPYWVYGGLQDNGSWAGPTQTARGGVIHSDWVGLSGGDGFHVQVDPSDWAWAYSESQGGAVVRTNQKTGESRFIRPRAPEGETYRFNWSTPLLLSPHNPEILYVGGNKLFRSLNRGESYEEISPDLTTDDPRKQLSARGVSPEATSAENHCTLVTISESPRKPGVLWVGSDDGLVHVTQDSGKAWARVSDNLPAPAGTWVSRVVASAHKDERAYVTLDGHRNDDEKPYVFVTEDYGKTWKSLGENLPLGSVYVIREGLTNPDLLMLGTEFGLWFSLDRGASWTPYASDPWPTVRVDDLVVHPREGDLVVGTHGRSIWILPIQPLESLTQEALKKDVVLCKPATVYSMGRVTSMNFDGDRGFVSRNTQPTAQVFYYLKTETSEAVKVVISDASGKNRLGEVDGGKKAGLNRVAWRPARRSDTTDLRVELTIGGKTVATETLRVEALDPAGIP